MGVLYKSVSFCNNLSNPSIVLLFYTIYSYSRYYNSDAGYKIQSRGLPLHLETLNKFTHYITTLMHSNKFEG